MQKLTDSQWELIRAYFPEEKFPKGRPGRKPVPTRDVLDAVLWILNTGAQWHMLPQCYANYKTVHRRFQRWCEQHVLRQILTDLANALRDQGNQLAQSRKFSPNWQRSAAPGSKWRPVPESGSLRNQ